MPLCLLYLPHALYPHILLLYIILILEYVYTSYTRMYIPYTPTYTQVLALNSPYPCFHGKDPVAIIDKLRARFRTELSVNETVHHCLDLIIASYGHYGTKQYDSFQYYTNGILS